MSKAQAMVIGLSSGIEFGLGHGTIIIILSCHVNQIDLHTYGVWTMHIGPIMTP